MHEQGPEIRPGLEEVPEIRERKDIPIDVIEGILDQIKKEEEGEEEVPPKPTIH